MDKNKKRRLMGTLAFLCVCVMLGACGGQSEDPTPEELPTMPPSQPETPVSTADPTPAGGADTPLIPGAGTHLVTGPDGPEGLMIAFDGDGILHLVWGDKRRGFSHKQMAQEGAWSEAEILTGDFETLFNLVDLIRDPSGQMCVFFDAATVSIQPGTAGLYMRCLVQGQWSPTGDLRARGSRAYKPAFALDGTLQAVYSAGGAHNAVQFADINLSGDEGTVIHHELAVDKGGRYHVMWQRSAGGTHYLEHRYSNDGGQTWSEIERFTDMPLLITLSLIADGQGVHVVGWAGTAGVFYKRWTPAGGWGSVVEVAGETAGGAWGDAAVGPHGLVHIVWGDGSEIKHYVRQLSDGSWSHPQLITSAKIDGARIAIDDRGVRHFVWEGEDGGLDYAAAPVTLLTIETFRAGEPVTIRIDDTVYLCEDDLPYSIVQVTGSGERPVMLQHSCIGFAGTGVDRYCENGQIKTVIVRTCSDAVFCEETRLSEAFTWDQQEYVEISETCAGEPIRREARQQVPEGKYEVTVSYWQDDHVVTGVIKEFMITSNELNPAELTGATVEEAVSRLLEAWVTAPHRIEHIEVLEDDGARSSVKVVAHFRTSADPGWTMREATVECQKREGGWLCEEPFSFQALPQQVIPVFEYPSNNGVIGYDGSFLFKVQPIAGAEEYQWVFIQNGMTVWDTLRDEEGPAGNAYGIHPGTEAHSKFAAGGVEVWVRARINGEWTYAGIITIELR
jgi:hypothetical protein